MKYTIITLGIYAVASVPMFNTFIGNVGSEFDARKQANVRYEVPLEVVSERPVMPSYSDEVDHLSDELQKAFKINDERADKFADWILMSSVYSHVPYQMLAGLIMTESSFRYNVVSSVGAIGPGQIRPQFWQNECVELDLNDPKDNVECAGRIMRHYYDDHCDQTSWGCALAYYNVGPTNYKSSQYYRDAGARYQTKVANHSNMISIPTEFNQTQNIFAAIY